METVIPIVQIRVLKHIQMVNSSSLTPERPLCPVTLNRLLWFSKGVGGAGGQTQVRYPLPSSNAPAQCPEVLTKGQGWLASSFQSTSCQNPEIRGEGPGGRSWHRSPTLRNRFSRAPVDLPGPVRGAFSMSRKQGASGVEIRGWRGQGRTLAWE